MLTRRSVLSLFLLAVLFACATLMWFAMRTLMDVGGSCASGNSAYAIRTKCPDVAGWALPGGMLVGFAAFFSFAYTSRFTKPGLAVWPVLFLSMGWNFLEYGVRASGGLAVSWLVCGVAFVVMGLVPVWWARPTGKAPTRQPLAPAELQLHRARLAESERLHATGVLTDEEFAARRAANPATDDPAVTGEPDAMSRGEVAVHTLAMLAGVGSVIWIWFAVLAD